MRYFTNPRTNEVHAYDDDAAEQFIPSYLLPMSDEAVQSYIASASAPLLDAATEERNWRDVELTSVLWLRERHRDQLEIEAPATLTVEQFKELLVYMQALRDWPQSADFPDVKHRPAAPPWIAEQLE
ncbi:phage tail assembly chaperone [Pseudomonas protegens]|uniref:phage tail assembly chaperone n=1 Tax=Pseudomonas protegens TaxID=380021 RepID=UPI00287F14FB|nr:phage tail assembly chaperone [Pseudomonas protegens]MDS9873554.1 phage tail assembly chaperone [Pseudomonas protegens]